MLEILLKVYYFYSLCSVFNDRQGSRCLARTKPCPYYIRWTGKGWGVPPPRDLV